MPPSFNIAVYCRDCNVYCGSAPSFASHTKTSKHQFTSTKQQRFCGICDEQISGGTVAWAQHIRGARHIRKLGDATTPKKDRYCNVCKKYPPRAKGTSHFESSAHLAKQTLLTLASTYLEAEKDKFTVTIEPKALDFGIIRPSSGAVRALSIKTKENGIRLSSCQLRSSFQATGGRTSSFNIKATPPIDLIAGKCTGINISFNSQMTLGYFNDSVELVFESITHAQKFTIIRSISARVGDPVDFETLQPVGPYVRPPQKKKNLAQSRGKQRLRPSGGGSRTTIPYVRDLLFYELPKENIITVGTLEQRIEHIRGSMPEHLTAETYKKYWQNLLWVEEDQMNQDLEVYDMDDVQLHQGGIVSLQLFVQNSRAIFYIRLFHAVDVPGLAEKRPSVLRGDHIEIRLKHRHDVVYEGLVQTIEDIRVGMHFHNDFRKDWHQGALCEVRFMMNRVPLRRMHQALDVPFLPQRVLFPEDADFDGILRVTKEQIGRIVPKNDLLASNPPQMEAVAAIVNQPPGAPPFVIFGPPGTGKTVTVVEAILQILHKNPDARIFACAPSNPAADLIALRLIDKGIGREKLFRMNATYRDPRLLPPSLQPYTYKDGFGHFSVTSREDLESFRIIVSTCGSASIPYGVGMEAGHFTHIVIDEAGQALEPECMIPIKTMGSPKTNFILAGDPNQLGPIIRSDVARSFGFAVSYLERMMSRLVYNETRGQGISVVKLTKNWRNHQAILQFPNEKFYGGDLEVCAHPSVKDVLLGSPVLPNLKFPVVFHGVAGKDEREKGSPSYFNIPEITQVVDYVRKLLADQSHPVVHEDICVIAPYNAQAKKTRERLEKDYGKNKIKVGSVEMCQGEEFKVVIMTTVRTEPQQVLFDLRHALGFLVNPRRMNVAITRAQALLVVVGDPRVLGLDPLWRKLLNYIYINGGWKGFLPDWDPYNDDEDGDEGDKNRFINRKRQEWESEMDRTAERLRTAVTDRIGTASGTAASGVDYNDETQETNDDRAWPTRDDED